MKIAFGLLALTYGNHHEGLHLVGLQNKPNKPTPRPKPTTRPKPSKGQKPSRPGQSPSAIPPTQYPYPPTTTYGKYADQDGNQYGSYGYDDPHFSVQAPGQERLCFDFHPLGEMSLLIDPESALSITATAVKASHRGRTYMNSIHFSSPNGAHLEFSMAGVELAGLGDQKATDPHSLTGHQEYGDISFIERYSKNGNHEHTRVNIKDGPTFEIVSTKTKGALSISVLDYAGISEKSRGVIGQFLGHDAYMISSSGETDNSEHQIGTLKAGPAEFQVVKQKYHRDASCWVISEINIRKVMENLS